ncbi:MAG: hypothetical protein ACOYS2_00420, partial [Patescibacteria group bacterium]
IIDHATSVSLWQGRKMLDEAQVGENKRISLELLPKLDKLVKKNKLDWKNISKIKLSSNISSSFTTSRIVQTIKNVLEFSRNEK